MTMRIEDLHTPDRRSWPLVADQRLLLSVLPGDPGERLVWDIEHDARHDIVVEVEILVAGTEEPRGRLLCAAYPGLTSRYDVPWGALDGETVFLKRTPGRGKCTMFVQGIDPAAVTAMTFRLWPSESTVAVTLIDPRVVNGPVDHPLPDHPLVDVMGQWIGKDWPGKCGDVKAMVAAIHSHDHEARPWPEDFSRFGGYGPVDLGGTGFFRVGEWNGRPCLVDPDGHPFWSSGIDCVHPGVGAAVVPGSEGLFEALPEPEASAAPFTNPPDGRGFATINHGCLNLFRAFGDGWRSGWDRYATRLLKDWGFNTVGNWSDTDFARRAGLPYVLPMPPIPKGGSPLFRDLPDVFDPAWEESLTVWAGHLESFADDPLLIGYFLGNEPQWGFGTFNLAAEMLLRRPGSHSRRAFAGWLRERYDSAAALAAAWDGLVGGFDDIVEREVAGAEAAQGACANDCWAFGAVLVERFIGRASAAARRVAPHHLNLGNRWAWIASDLAYAGSDHLDVFSINSYAEIPDAELVATIRKRTGKPVMIGEWHFGALDRGPLGNALQGVASQADRGIAFRRYCESAVSIDGLVGAHWFQLNDQAALGRFDGENWNLGFLDVCRLPYPEMAAAARASHERLYDLLVGAVEPFDQQPTRAPKVAN